MTFDAYWLPGLPAQPGLLSHTSGQALFRYPDLDGRQVLAVCQNLRAAAGQTRHRSVRDRIAAVHNAAALLIDPNGRFFTRACDLVAAATGYSPAMTRLVIQRIAQDWSEDSLQKLAEAELGNPAVLDGPIKDNHAHRYVSAFGPGLTAHIFSGNVPGVAVTSLIRALIVKSASFGKTARDEPVLPVLFAQALHEVAPELAATIAVSCWPGGSAQPESALYSEADALVVYGGPEAVDAAFQHTRPDCRFVVHGPRISLGLIAPAALDPASLPQTAEQVARAVATFDQQGCVSPHVIYVLGSIELATTLATELAAELGRLQDRLPRGRLSTAEAVAIQEARTRAEFRAIAGEDVSIHSAQNAAFTVILDPDERFLSSCLNRFVYVKPLADTARLDPLLNDFRPFLQSVAIAGFTEQETLHIAHSLGQLGVSRLSSFSGLPWPPPEWHHDGAGPLRELLRWVDVEI